MSECKWTKGPWHIHRRAATSVIGGEHAYSVASCGGWSDTIRDPDELREEQEANAQLISAAPELYEALSIAVKDGPAGYVEWLDYAYEVLAKARGEQP